MLRIDRAKLHAFVELKCQEIERQGDWASIPAYPAVKGAILTAYQEEKLKALGGKTLALSLAEGIAYAIGNHLLFHAAEFLTWPRQLPLVDERKEGDCAQEAQA